MTPKSTLLSFSTLAHQSALGIAKVTHTDLNLFFFLFSRQMQRTIHVTRIARCKPTTALTFQTNWRRSFGSCQTLCSKSDSNRGSRNNADPQVIALEQQLFDEYMIPGRYFQYFKTKQRKNSSKATEENSTLQQKPLKPAKLNEYDPTPTEIQQRVAQRIQRGIATMYTVEKLPLRVSPSCLAIHSVSLFAWSLAIL